MRIFKIFFCFSLFVSLSLSLSLSLSYPNCYIFPNGVFVYQVTMLQLGEHNINALKMFSQFCSQHKLHCCAHFFYISPNGSRSVHCTAVWRIVANWVKSTLSLGGQTQFSGIFTLKFSVKSRQLSGDLETAHGKICMRTAALAEKDFCFCCLPFTHFDEGMVVLVR